MVKYSEGKTILPLTVGESRRLVGLISGPALRGRTPKKPGEKPVLPVRKRKRPAASPRIAVTVTPRRFLSLVFQPFSHRPIHDRQTVRLVFQRHRNRPRH